MAANLWYIGMILAIFASMAGTIGKQLIRFSEVQHIRRSQTGEFTSKLSMIIALVLMTVIGPLIDMGSYAFAPQSLIAPLGALDVVWNTLLAPFTLGESLNRLLVLGCVLIAAGAVATSLVGTHEDSTYTLKQMEDIFIRWQVLAYLLTLLVFISFNVCVPMRLSAAPKGEPWQPGNKIRGLAMGLTAGSIAGNMFCVKGFVEIVQASIKNKDGDMWLNWLPYAMFVGAIFFALSNLYFLSKGMKEYEALFMGSIFEGALIFFACLSGGIVFKEFEVLKAYEFAIYCAALLGIVGGIAAVAKGSGNNANAVHASHHSEADKEPPSAPQDAPDGLDKATAELQASKSNPSLDAHQRTLSQASGNSGTSIQSTPSCRSSPFRQAVPLTIRDVLQDHRKLSSSSLSIPNVVSPVAHGAHGHAHLVGAVHSDPNSVRPLGKESSTA